MAQEFAAVVHRLELHYVNAMIDRRDTKAGTSSSHWPDAAMLDSTGSAPIDSDISYWAILNGFFPFDPYQLPKSSSYIEGLYLEWQDAEDDVEDGRREPSSGGIGIGIGLRTEDADSSEDDDLDKLLSISMSVSY